MERLFNILFKPLDLLYGALKISPATASMASAHLLMASIPLAAIAYMVWGYWLLLLFQLPFFAIAIQKTVISSHIFAKDWYAFNQDWSDNPMDDEILRHAVNRFFGFSCYVLVMGFIFIAVADILLVAGLILIGVGINSHANIRTMQKA